MVHSVLQFFCLSQLAVAVQCSCAMPKDLHGLFAADVCIFLIVIDVATAAALGAVAVISSTAL
jgi:hypothetical protein